eukprot:6188126-Pleurochrysis_carterae.AAC.6
MLRLVLSNKDTLPCRTPTDDSNCSTHRPILRITTLAVRVGVDMEARQGVIVLALLVHHALHWGEVTLTHGGCCGWSAANRKLLGDGYIWVAATNCKVG